MIERKQNPESSRGLPFDVEFPLKAALEGGGEIMKIYRASTFNVQLKGDDTPVTFADTQSHAAIFRILSQTGFPVLSEEGKAIDYLERKSWESFWLVDPLDGTKEFIKRNGQFAINIAFIDNGVPLWGMIFIPVTGEVYLGSPRSGLYEIHLPEGWEYIPVEKLIANYPVTPNIQPLEERRFVVVTSRSHDNALTSEIVNYAMQLFFGVDNVQVGSAIKQAMVASGKAHFYPRLGKTMEWDTAAGHALVRSVGGDIIDIDTYLPLKYNKPNLQNPDFYCHRGDLFSRKLLDLLRGRIRG
ncbi:MAG: 3'(2'),5'-bisphosphate nucleotidase CysQ [Breznakibacter sp.]